MKKSLQIQSVLFCNDKEALIQSLTSLENAILVDASTELSDVTVYYGDASQAPIFEEEEIKELQKRYTDVFSLKYKFFNDNTGTAKGHNLLALSSEAEYLMIMNPDVLLAPSFFSEIFYPFNHAEFAVGIAEARQVPIEHPKDYDFNTGETSWASTATAVVSTADFCAVSGFDSQSFFMYCDDVDFSWRIRQLGKKVIFCSNAMIFHAKRLRANGAWCSTATEKYYSAEAALMLSHKWSNSKRCDYLFDKFSKSSDENHRRAAKEFDYRRNNGLLVAQIDEEHKIASFIDDFYAVHRFTM